MITSHKQSDFHLGGKQLTLTKMRKSNRERRVKYVNLKMLEGAKRRKEKDAKND